MGAGMSPPLALIMCGGADTKWTDLGGQGRRHLQLIDGERLIDRTIRQLRERGVVDIGIIAPEDMSEYTIRGTWRIAPKFDAWGHESLNARDFWLEQGTTLQVYGDTVFTELAMDLVVKEYPGFRAIGRHGPGGISPYGELFAISIPRHGGQAWEAALRKAFDLKRQGIIGRAGSWEGYRIMAGAFGRDVRKHRLYRRFFVNVIDGTDDFDTPDEYMKMLELVATTPGFRARA
jgi:hypothetical protein